MKKIITILLVLTNIILIAQPALAEDAYTNQMEFTEGLGDNAPTTYFNPENTTPLPQELGLTDGIYKGPQYPYAAVKLDVRDMTTIYLNFTINLTYQDIMNGAWDWKLLIPLSGEFTNWKLSFDKNTIRDNYQGDYVFCHFTNQTTKYGNLFHIWYPLYPGSHHFTFQFTTTESPTLYLCRETQPATLDIIQSGKRHFQIYAAYAFLFTKGFSQKGMGGMEIPKNSILSIKYAGCTDQNDTYASLLLPIYVASRTTVQLTIIEHRLIYTEIGWIHNPGDNNITTFNITLDKGFNYIFQSNPHPANYTDSNPNNLTVICWGLEGYFQFHFSQPVKMLFCSYAAHNLSWDDMANNRINTTLNNKSLDNLGIVYSWNYGVQQYAKVTKVSGATIYDFGFASVQEYSNGDYIVLPHGNYKEWVIIKNVTVKSIGAQVDDILFGGRFEFSAHNDILSIILGGITKIIDLGKKILSFLMHLGQIIWQYLMKFIKFLINLASWIWDSLGGIFNYLLYVLIPTAMMFVISYATRWAKGLRATDEKSAGVHK